jgi:two-component sensor histidine kinase
MLALAFTVSLSFTFDAVRLSSFSLMWIPINVISVAGALLLIVPVVVYKAKKNVRGDKQPVFNLIVAGLYFGIKNVFTLYITPLLGIADEGMIATRFFGGVVIGIAVLVIYTNIVGTRLERENSLNKLGKAESLLLNFREIAFDRLEEENLVAAKRAVRALTPQIETLKQSVRQSEDIVSLANRLKAFIENDLRPLGAKLAQDAFELSKLESAKSSKMPEEGELFVNISSSIRVWVSFFPVPLTLMMISSYAIPDATLLDILLASAVFGVTLAFLKLLLKRLPEIPVSRAFIAITFIALISALPTYYLLAVIPNPLGVPELMPVFYCLPGFAVLSASQAYILDQKQARVEARLSEVIRDLEFQNKIYEQKVWLTRHGWYLLLHGVVQPALTSAAIRASHVTDLTEQTKSQILSDLERALESLSTNKQDIRSIEEHISEIQSVWKGVCEVSSSVDTKVITLAESNPTLVRVLNEILKEVASNAVRHGNASKLDIKLTVASATSVRVHVANNGRKPTLDNTSSVGSLMLEALCLSRSLEWNPKAKATEFKAIVPVSG